MGAGSRAAAIDQKMAYLRTKLDRLLEDRDEERNTIDALHDWAVKVRKHSNVALSAKNRRHLRVSHERCGELAVQIRAVQQEMEHLAEERKVAYMEAAWENPKHQYYTDRFYEVRKRFFALIDWQVASEEDLRNRVAAYSRLFATLPPHMRKLWALARTVIDAHADPPFPPLKLGVHRNKE